MNIYPVKITFGVTSYIVHVHVEAHTLVSKNLQRLFLPVYDSKDRVTQ